MKNRTTQSNGTTIKATKPTSASKIKSPLPWEMILAREDAAKAVKIQEANARHQNATVDLTIKISADTYGLLCAGGVIHGTSPAELAAEYLEQEVCEWSNHDFLLED